VSIKPELLRWAVGRSGVHETEFRKRFPRFGDWEQGDTGPTYRQLKEFAKAAKTPVGYLFLDEPPADRLPITDFRTKQFSDLNKPSPDLLDTIHLCQQRQAWYRDELLATGGEPLDYVSSLQITSGIKASANLIRSRLGFGLATRRFSRTDAAVRQFARLAEDSGVLVMISGIVGANTHRALDPEEFRGFALVDPIAPVVFINGTDAKSAQMFTLAHELAHIWVGQSGVSNLEIANRPPGQIEEWCNRVAAELLVPSEKLIEEFSPHHELGVETSRLASVFKVSAVVLLRAVRDGGLISDEQFWNAYQKEMQRIRIRPRRGGGNSINNVAPRASRRFTETLIASTLEGRTTYTECFRLLGVKSNSTFEKVAEQLRAHG
jgi:Zn-dependent peptidase ImmA (M78 family)